MFLQELPALLVQDSLQFHMPKNVKVENRRQTEISGFKEKSTPYNPTIQNIQIFLIGINFSSFFSCDFFNNP